MDTLSHALWGKGLFGYRKYRWYSFLFGALPDLFSFGIYFIYSIFFSSSPIMGRPTRSEIPEWVYSLYDISHSMVIASIIIFIVYKINKEFAFPMLAWPAHIILDFFTHSIEFFPHQYFGRYQTLNLTGYLGLTQLFSLQMCLLYFFCLYIDGKELKKISF
ncbi:MAG: hypothetical protein ACJ0NI_00125 [Flavobacteriaceae bacterium]